MKYAVVYNSPTGNTKEIADIIACILPSQDLVYAGDLDITKVMEADVIFLGFWTDKGSCSEDVIEYLGCLHDKQIALFGTCGFGESSEYFDVILQRVSAFIEDDCTYLDGFMCQGRMPSSVRNRYEMLMEQSDDKEKFIAMIQNFDTAMLHPNEDDFKHARAFAQIIVKSCE